MFRLFALFAFVALSLVVARAAVTPGPQLKKALMGNDENKLSSKIPSSIVRRLINIRAGSNVIHVASSDEFKTILDSTEGLVVVDFSASWCMPCKLIAPVFDEMAKPDGDYPGVTFIKVDVDEVPGSLTF
jgi:thiol-disulfide isomerase/thioredoxin